MLKAIIVEDDKKISIPIEKMIDWDGFNVEIVATTGNGIDALNLICEHRPDIVFTDIRIPGIDGIELMQRTKESGFSSRFIIISSFPHFEYARRAMRYGAKDYLLKPVRKQELVEALLRESAEIEAEKKKLEEKKHIDEILRKNKKRINRDFILNFLYDPSFNKDLSIERINEEYFFEFSDGLYNAAIIKLDFEESSLYTPNWINILYEIEKIAEKYLHRKCTEVVTFVKGKSIFIVDNYTDDLKTYIKECYKVIFNEAKIITDEIPGWRLTIGVGKEVNEPYKIYETIKAAEDALRYRTGLGIGRIIWFDDYTFDDIDIGRIIKPEVERELLNCFEALSINNFEELLTNIFNTMYAIPGINPCLYFDTGKRIIDIMLSSMRRTWTGSNNRRTLVHEISDVLENAISPEMVHNMLSEWISRQMRNFMIEKNMRENKPIRLAKEYIKKHYMLQLSLNDVAQIVHLNPSYFSTIFKKEVGINFNDYLIDCRLNTAKELLRNTNLSISQITEQIGYNDSRYFSKLFIKIVGIKPTEYRALYS